ncbi:WXG100 family type VII secretion target [Kribbia dieselivorans]|uniref:WXG100 family type VII secretion target n=1 Tax=Kribbia dieselivorans TaxID=331526 RepID=UPI0008391ACA|nr:WXG100 family type VII secretion target [Kribbia dieselivorans]
MSSQFQVDTGRIAGASGDIARISADIEAQTAAMMTRLVALEDAWTGSAAARFQSVVAEWRATQGKVREALDSIGTALGVAGTQYSETEAANLRMFT